MEDHNFFVNVDLTDSKKIYYKFLGTVRGEKNPNTFLNLAFHIIQLSPAFTLQSCFKLCCYVHIKAFRGLSCYIRKTHYTRDCFIFLELFGRLYNIGFIGRIMLACVQPYGYLSFPYPTPSLPEIPFSLTCL